jgi:NAD(P)-dependent dehydrogenase (short-subunit alcohol dehydrogenase family)
VDDRKSIFITGAASGIGRAAARLFIEKGWFAGLYDVNEKGIEDLSKELGTHATCYQRLDVTSASEVKAAVAHFTQRSNGKIHALFNSAGLLRAGSFEAMPSKAHRDITRVNVEGVMNCTHEAFPWLRDTEGAVVVNMSSASALYGTPEFCSYSASKFWVRGFTEALNMEWACHGIHVCDIMPPFVDTPMLEGVQTGALDSMGMGMTAEDVALAVWRAVHRRRVHWPLTASFGLQWHLGRGLPDRIVKMGMKRTCGI